jgi:hypothetical protein
VKLHNRPLSAMSSCGEGRGQKRKTNTETALEVRDPTLYSDFASKAGCSKLSHSGKTQNWSILTTFGTTAQGAAT